MPSAPPKLGLLVALLACTACGDDSNSTSTARVRVALERTGVPLSSVALVLSYPPTALRFPPDLEDACEVAFFSHARFDFRAPGELNVSLSDDEEDDSEPDGEGDDGFSGTVGCGQVDGSPIVLDCSFTANGPLSEDDFDVRVVDATDFSGAVPDPLPRGFVADVHMIEPSSPDEGNAPAYDIVLSVVNDVGPLGALQFNARFFGGGGFVGAGGTVQCASLIPGSIATFNDVGTELRGGMISLDGLPTPGDLVECTFKSSGSVLPENFEIEIVDVADVEGAKPPACPEMAVTSVEPDEG